MAAEVDTTTTTTKRQNKWLANNPAKRAHDTKLKKLGLSLDNVEDQTAIKKM
jgi:hypothetical protein